MKPKRFPIVLLFVVAPIAASLAFAGRRPESQPKPVVARIWRGRVATARADAYYAYLKEAGITKIESIPGNLGAQVLRRNNGKETEFIVISYWPSRDAIRAFAGNDIEKTHNLPRDHEFLIEMEPNVKHFDVVLDERKR